MRRPRIDDDDAEGTKLWTFRVPIRGEVEVVVKGVDEAEARMNISDALWDKKYELVGFDQNGEAKPVSQEEE